MTKTRYHVVPETGGWAIKRDSQSGRFMSFTTKGEAEKVARQRAQSEDADVVIHGQDGRVRETTIRPKGFGSHRGEFVPKEGIDLTRPIAEQVQGSSNGHARSK